MKKLTFLECANPCMDDIPPICGEMEKRKSWEDQDECGNVCKRFECSKFIFPICHENRL